MSGDEIGGEVLLANAEATEAAGQNLGRALRHAGAVVFLQGNLGAGKTTLARGWLRALGATGPIRSPTYTLVEPYELEGQRWLHLDLYRLNDPSELEQLGLADSPPELGGWLVEWPARGSGFLPPPTLDLQLSTAHDGRRLRWNVARNLETEVKTALDHFR